MGLRFFDTIVLLFFLLPAGSGPAAKQPYLRADLLNRAKASVVSVQVYVSHEGEPLLKIGSGFVYDGDGFIITRRSLVQEGDSIVVTLTDGRITNAWIVYNDADTGTALLKIPYDDVSPASLGRSADLLAESAVTILGNSLGTFPSVTMGTFLGMRGDGNLHVDAMVPPGNCGSPVLDELGRVVGLFLGREICGAGTRELPEPLGVALPIERVQTETDRVLRHVREGKGWIGITVSKLDGMSGVRVVRVARDGPTDRAQIAVGDTIVAFEGRPIQGPTDLAKHVRQMPPNREIVFTVLRGGRRDERTVRIGEEPWASAPGKER